MAAPQMQNKEGKIPDYPLYGDTNAPAPGPDPQLQHCSSRTRPGEENGLWKWGGLMHKIILHGYQGRRRRKMQKRAALLPVRLLPWIVLYVWAMPVICISKQNTKYGSNKR